MGLTKILHSDVGKVVISIMLGLGVATLCLNTTQSNPNNIEYRGFNIEDIDSIFKFDGKCYSYNPTSVTCNSQKKTVQF